MPVFKKTNEAYQRLDWEYFRDRSIVLYHSLSILREHVIWFQNYGYIVHLFECSSWDDEETMHTNLAAVLEFPEWYGENLDAFNDCIRNTQLTGEGLVLVFKHYDHFATRFPEVAWHVLNILERQSRNHLIYGDRLFTLVQSDDPTIKFSAVGARQVRWNNEEGAPQDRGL